MLLSCWYAQLQLYWFVFGFYGTRSTWRPGVRFFSSVWASQFLSWCYCCSYTGSCCWKGEDWGYRALLRSWHHISVSAWCTDHDRDKQRSRTVQCRCRPQACTWVHSSDGVPSQRETTVFTPARRTWMARKEGTPLNRSNIRDGARSELAEEGNRELCNVRTLWFSGRSEFSIQS